MDGLDSGDYPPPMATGQIRVSLLDVPPVLAFIRCVGQVTSDLNGDLCTSADAELRLSDALDALSRSVITIPDEPDAQ